MKERKNIGNLFIDTILNVFNCYETFIACISHTENFKHSITSERRLVVELSPIAFIYCSTTSIVRYLTRTINHILRQNLQTYIMHTKSNCRKLLFLVSYVIVV